MEHSKIGTYRLVAEPFHVDFSGSLFLGVLGNHLLNCAGFHAKERGLGMASLNESNYTWVLSRLVVEMERMPKEFEEFTVDTWIENVYRLFTDRNFAVCDASGTPIGYARSIWAMINMDTRKPADLLLMHDGHIVDYIESEKPCPIEKFSRIKLSNPECVRTYPVVYSDIDVNGHVNSVKYVEHVLDLFPLETYRTQYIRRFEVAYIAEGHVGDTLLFYKESCGDGVYDIEIRRAPVADGKEETLCRFRIYFSNK